MNIRFKKKAFLIVLLLLFFYVLKTPKKISSPFECIDYILVKKKDRILEIYHKGKHLKSYTIQLGFSPTGQKQYEGDGKTPEGLYTICFKNLKSRYHLSLKIDYPHDDHTMAAQAKGLSAGGDIMIHGHPNVVGSYTPKDIPWGLYLPKDMRHDWTHGCIAVTNQDIEEIYGATSVGTPIEIRP